MTTVMPGADLPSRTRILASRSPLSRPPATENGKIACVNVVVCLWLQARLCDCALDLRDGGGKISERGSRSKGLGV